MNKPINFYKKVAKTYNRLLIPQMAIDRWGREYILEIHEDRMVLIPLANYKGEKANERIGLD